MASISSAAESFEELVVAGCTQAVEQARFDEHTIECPMRLFMKFSGRPCCTFACPT